MPNWCSNVLNVSSSVNDEQLCIDSLFDGSFVNRTDEITTKLRKILLAGICGLLKPCSINDHNVLRAAINLNRGLATNQTQDDAAGEAYSGFLAALVNGTISPSMYEYLDFIYRKTAVENLAWGDISKEKRKIMKSIWKKCSYEFTGKFFGTDISLWWSTCGLYKNTSVENVLDLHVLADIPVSVMVNGFNGGILECGNMYHWSIDNLGTKWAVFEVDNVDDGKYSFSTAWSPATPIVDLLPEFVAKSTNKQVEDLDVSCDLYYFETGCAFQGVNHSVSELEFIYNEEEDYHEEQLLPEIAEAFDY